MNPADGTEKDPAVLKCVKNEWAKKKKEGKKLHLLLIGQINEK